MSDCARLVEPLATNTRTHAHARAYQPLPGRNPCPRSFTTLKLLHPHLLVAVSVLRVYTLACGWACRYQKHGFRTLKAIEYPDEKADAEAAKARADALQQKALAARKTDKAPATRACKNAVIVIDSNSDSEEAHYHALNPYPKRRYNAKDAGSASGLLYGPMDSDSDSVDGDYVPPIMAYEDYSEGDHSSGTHQLRRPCVTAQFLHSNKPKSLSSTGYWQCWQCWHASVRFYTCCAHRHHCSTIPGVPQSIGFMRALLCEHACGA